MDSWSMTRWYSGDRTHRKVEISGVVARVAPKTEMKDLASDSEDDDSPSVDHVGAIPDLPATDAEMKRPTKN